MGCVGQSIPQTYATFDNMQADHQESIIDMDGKIYDQVIYTLIKPVSNYSYVNPDLVDKCSFNKEVHLS